VIKLLFGLGMEWDYWR